MVQVLIFMAEGVYISFVDFLLSYRALIGLHHDFVSSCQLQGISPCVAAGVTQPAATVLCSRMPTHKLAASKMERHSSRGDHLGRHSASRLGERSS